ncbi:MAG: hypothetical protein HW416_1332, partial [Chloroflexi bacterium]|nr:hypothetical protein [Chloroflexota bacterium]
MTNLKPIEFGIFMPVANNGWIMSRNSPQFMPTWELNREVGLLAEEIGLHYLFSMGKWRGLDGETEFWNYTSEAMALSTALAVVTSKVRIVASVAPLLIHPAVMAKMISTIDDVSGGRISINIITSGNQQEYGQMGLQPDDWDSYRYDYIEEWLEVARRLWTEDRVNFEGKWFTLKDCMCNPKPVQKPHPRVVCAMA